MDHAALRGVKVLDAVLVTGGVTVVGGVTTVVGGVTVVGVVGVKGVVGAVDACAYFCWTTLNGVPVTREISSKEYFAASIAVLN